MYFCPKCHFSFDIGKTNNNSVTDDKELIKKSADAFKKLEDNQDLSNYKADFKFEELLKNSKYKKLSEGEKNMLDKLFEQNINSGIEFKCNNCNFTKDINETVLLYSYDLSSKDENIKSAEENELLCKNPILPRTHDYICKNISCVTNLKNAKKEAVFFREPNNFKVNYICCICFSSW
jgi:hypothetical protein